MRYGNHMMGYGFYGGYILLSVIVVLAGISIYLYLKNKKTSNPEVVPLLNLIKYDYANGKISTEEYNEKREILESSDLLNPTILALVEMYIRSNLTLDELYTLNQRLDEGVIIKDDISNIIRKEEK